MGIFSTNNLKLSLEPPLAWTAILSLVTFSTLCVVVGFGKILNFAFPAGTVAVGLLLYIRYPILYNGFTWWIWLLAAFVRRLADYRGGGFTDPSPILLTPYLVTFISTIALWKNLTKTHRHGGLPFILTFISLLYGLLVGFIYQPPLKVVIDFLDWFSPVLLGFYLFVNWQNYPSYRKNIQRVFLWAVLIMGIYGIIQYLLFPEWERFWLINAPISSTGKPEPMGCDVWSTLNSAEPFAAFMAAALLLLLNYEGVLRFPAFIAGYLSFLLSMVRSAWAGWFVGMLLLLNFLKPKLQLRLVLTILVMTMLVVPLLTLEPFSGVILDRIETFSNFEDDSSAKARQKTYQENFGLVLTSFLGQGLGGLKYDSNVLAMLLNLGWLGTLFYLLGLLILIFSFFRGNESQFDPFLAAARAIILSVLVRIPLNSALLEISGIVLWSFLGMGIAAKKYYNHERSQRSRLFFPPNSNRI